MPDETPSTREIGETEEQAKNPGIKEAVELYDKDDTTSGQSEDELKEVSLIDELPFVN